MALLPLLMLTTASSPTRSPGYDLVENDGVVYVRYEDDSVVHFTLDGSTFEPWSSSSGLSADDLSWNRLRGVDCVDRRCYRLTYGELHIESSDDLGPWRTEWQLSGVGFNALRQEYGVRRPVSQSLAVLSVLGGHVVLVNNGADGLLRRDVDGRWERMVLDGGALVPAPPLPSTVGFALNALATALFAAGCCLAIAAVRGYARAGSRHEDVQRKVLRGALGVGLLALCLAGSVPVAAVCAAVLVCGSVFSLARLTARGSLGWPPALAIIAVAVTVGMACYLDRLLLIRTLLTFGGPLHGHLLALCVVTAAASVLTWRLAGRTALFYLSASPGAVAENAAAGNLTNGLVNR